MTRTSACLKQIRKQSDAVFRLELPQDKEMQRFRDSRRSRSALAAIMLAAIISPQAVTAQQVSEQRIVAGLGKLTAAAPLVDVAILQQEAMAGNGKTMESLPNWSKVSRLPQMVVEINFKNDSVMIEPESYRTIGMIADALHHPNLWDYKFLVVGHTSSTGTEEHNLDLSEKRAAAIREILSTTFAVKPERLFAVGVGEYFPIASVKADAANNRRVQLFNLGVFKAQ